MAFEDDGPGHRSIPLAPGKRITAHTLAAVESGAPTQVQLGLEREDARGTYRPTAAAFRIKPRDLRALALMLEAIADDVEAIGEARR